MLALYCVLGSGWSLMCCFGSATLFLQGLKYGLPKLFAETVDQHAPVSGSSRRLFFSSAWDGMSSAEPMLANGSASYYRRRQLEGGSTYRYPQTGVLSLK